MRIRFGNRIKLCTNATLTPNSNLLLFTNSNGVYTVDMRTPENAKQCFERVLINGYLDVSDYEYSN